MDVINRANFANAVSLVLPGVARKELFAQANKLGISNGKLISYNDEISISTDFKEIDGIEGALDGVLLYELLQRITAADINVTTTESELIVRDAPKDPRRPPRMRATLKMLPLELPLGEIDESDDNKIPLPDTIKSDLRLIGEICATDMSRPLLTCIHIGNGWIEGSDGYRLARKRTRKELPEILLPAVAGLKIADYDKLDHLSVGLQGEWVHFALAQEEGANTEPTRVSSRIFTGTYPNLSRHYEVSDGVEFELKQDGIRGVLERASVFAHREHSIDEEIEVVMTVNDRGGGDFKVSASDDNGKFEEITRGPAIDAQFKIHPNFLKLALEGENTKCLLNQSKIKFYQKDDDKILWEHVIALR